ncbi:hypothetical protein [Boudabousia marimammalium]|uniref:Uncharacterized protein n=1 Tax=Boudabousia marimammalium TaxID=156892 RepID=A0A1Q5PS42_9ACTO|nr:hypothetical protein [Boudabousia marimammalium]OKL50252.1 hypothetical protein BM477_02345 [Boudabousia marimammalium]
MELQKSLDKDSKAWHDIDQLIHEEMSVFTRRNSERLGRKMDTGAIGAIVFVAIIGGGISYGLVTAAQYLTGFWSAFFWVITVAWTIFILLFVMVGGASTLYKTEEN